MTPSDLATLAIALLSLILSFWVLMRDRRQRQIDILYQCYERLHQAYGSIPFATPSELAAMDECPEDPCWEEYKQKSNDAQRSIERELEFACYMLVKKQINFEMFFYLFRGWLSGRERFWKHDHARAKSYPYTVKIIMLCRKKGLLPIKQNTELQELQEEVEKYLAS